MASPQPDANGKFELFYSKGWVYLTVRKPTGTGLPVYPEDVENRMRLLGMPRVGAKTIRDIIAEGSGAAAPLTEWAAGQSLVSTISVDIAKDGMAAYLTIAPPKKGAAAPTSAEVREELIKAGVVAGIDEDAIARMIETGAYGRRTKAAAGSPPMHGKSERIRFHFNADRGKPYLEMDFGRINLKELNFIENRREGDLLAELEPPVPAVDGQKVTGESISAERAAEAVRLRPGDNTRLDEEGTKLYAACDGNARFVDGKITVEPVITVKNVNYETGNIRFDGSVVIEGGIADGFVVDAGGDIQVGSGVGRAALKAGGSIILKTGINGNGEGRIECGGDLYAKYIESCTAVCRGNVFVEEAIMHSKVTAYRNCVLNGRRSEVIASEVVAGRSFWCKKLGNLYEAPTRLYVGVDPDLLAEYRGTAAGLLLRQEEWDKSERQLEQLGKLIHDGRADERINQAWAQLQATADRLGLEIAEFKKRFPDLREKMRASKSSFAVIEETMFKGAVAVFGTLEFRAPDNGIKKTILRAGEKEVAESGYNYHERPELAFAPE